MNKILEALDAVDDHLSMAGDEVAPEVISDLKITLGSKFQNELRMYFTTFAEFHEGVEKFSKEIEEQERMIEELELIVKAQGKTVKSNHENEVEDFLKELGVR